MEKVNSTLLNFEIEGVENLSIEEQNDVNGGGFIEFLGWCAGGAVCAMKCGANYLGITEPGQW